MFLHIPGAVHERGRNKTRQGVKIDSSGCSERTSAASYDGSGGHNTVRRHSCPRYRPTDHCAQDTRCPVAAFEGAERRRAVPGQR